jgi:histidyl-tRNA synthetase
VVIGDDEAQANEASVKPMQGGEQQRVAVQDLTATVVRLLKR